MKTLNFITEYNDICLFGEVNSVTLLTWIVVFYLKLNYSKGQNFPRNVNERIQWTQVFILLLKIREITKEIFDPKY